MNIAMKTCCAVPVALAIAGCWTFGETEYPQASIAAAENAATNITVAVAGFEALLTEYEAVHGYHTVYVPRAYGRRGHCVGGYYETVPVVTYVPQRRATDMFLRRAQDNLESAGFTLGSGTTDRTVEVRFEGPFIDTQDEMRKAAWQFFSLFFCDYGTARWSAKLRIRDSRTGRLLFHRDYEQKFETHVFALIPLFGPAANGNTSSAHMQSWCLAALTDAATADAAAFLSK